MKIETQVHGTVSVLVLHGPLTHEETADLRREVHHASEQRAGRVILDMRDVQYLDGAGIEALAESCGERRSGATRPRIAQLGETCREALELTGVIPRLDVFDTVENAIRSLKR